LAGPVYAAAVILDRKRRINGLADSKVLPAQRREVLAGRIKERAVAWSVASASVEEIDRINIFHASMLAMRRAVQQLGVRPEEAWVDGNHCPDLGCKARAIVDGDALHPVISAASILAKTARDAEMCALHERFPHYGFDRHKGYATTDHLDALGRQGPCQIHRRSFYAVRVFFQKDLFSESWSAMAETLRARSYRLYCEAKKFCAGVSAIADLDREQRRLKRDYADVFAAPDASVHVQLVIQLFVDTRAELRATPGQR
jgi:ribonuclease HII